METYFSTTGNIDILIMENLTVSTAWKKFITWLKPIFPLVITYTSACKNYFCQHWKHTFQEVETLMVVVMGMPIFLSNAKRSTH